MSAGKLWKKLAGLRAIGPYLAIELFLPGGSLLALLLWLSQRARNVDSHRRHAAPARDAAPKVEPEGNPLAFPATNA
jgi:hypothetical protein